MPREAKVATLVKSRAGFGGGLFSEKFGDTTFITRKSSPDRANGI
jgi:hypothetical protein